MSEMSEVHPDLVRAPCADLDLDERMFRVALQHLPVRDRLTPQIRVILGDSRHSYRLPWVARDRPIYSPGIMRDQVLYQRNVGLLHRPARELVLQLPMG